MTITTYQDLKRVIKNFSHRPNINDVIDDIIVLAEDRINQGLVLRKNETRATSVAPLDSRFVPLPARFYKMRALTLNRDPFPNNPVEDETDGAISEVIYKAPQSLYENIRHSRGRPRYFTVTSQLEFERPFDYEYEIEMSYFSNLIPLTEVNNTNDVLDQYPTLYYYGCMLFLAEFEQDTSRVMKLEQQFSQSLLNANKQEKKGRYGPAPRMNPQGSTP